jgi:NADH:ubiquinone oxidoreductase subunit
MAKLSLASILSTASILLFTWRRGTYVGEDQLGNRYYRGRPIGTQPRERRWVIYAGQPEASSVPPEWHGWLHHQMKDPPQAANTLRRSWQVPPRPNLTGTDKAYRPPGHTLSGGHRAAATGDYQSWSPKE